jgi:hypothetical protein
MLQCLLHCLDLLGYCHGSFDLLHWALLISSCCGLLFAAAVGGGAVCAEHFKRSAGECCGTWERWGTPGSGAAAMQESAHTAAASGELSGS